MNCSGITFSKCEMVILLCNFLFILNVNFKKDMHHFETKSVGNILFGSVICPVEINSIRSNIKRY